MNEGTAAEDKFGTSLKKPKRQLFAENQQLQSQHHNLNLTNSKHYAVKGVSLYHAANNEAGELI